VRRQAKERFGRENAIERDLADYLMFRERVDGVSLSPESNEFDYEDFIAFLDVEHYLGLRGSDTWSDAGNEGQLMLKRLIGKIIHERTMEALDALPSFYLRFAESLAPSDIVVTFNYDVLLERSLEWVGNPYRLFPNRYSKIGAASNVVDSSREEVTVLKMHGSVDWFSRKSFEILEEAHRPFGTKARDAIFSHPEVFRPTPLVDGPRNSDDPLLRIYRIDADKFYREPYPRETPVILSPSRVKIIYSDPVKEFWYGFQGAGGLNLCVGIIGFSLPGHDEYVRQSIYGLVHNFQHANLDLEFQGRRKTKLKLIDYRPDDASQREYRERFRFVDWARADVAFQGFGDSAVEMLFRR